jgi:F-type H+-transporting ATPase subunit delta
MRISKQARRDAKQLFRNCLVDGRLAEDRVRRTVQATIAQRPRGYLVVLSHFQRLVRLEVARRAARVQSAVPIPADLRSGLEANLSRVYGPGLTVEFADDPRLLGGLRVQVGSDVYDGSIEGRLATLAEQF